MEESESSLKGATDGESGGGGDQEEGTVGPSIEGAESRRKGGDGGDVYIGH